MRTAAEILKKARLELAVGLEEVAEKTKIPLRYLKNIESGRYDLLPGESYAKLYIKSYAQFLGLCGDDCVSFFRRDLAAKTEHNRKGFGKKESLLLKLKSKFVQTVKKVSLDPNRTKIAGLLVLFFLLAGYLFYQYFSYNAPPEIDYSVSCQKEGQQQWIVVEGKTDLDNTVSIDGIVVEIDVDGGFKEKILYVSGRNNIDIEVQSPLGNLRKATEEINCLDN